MIISTLSKYYILSYHLTSLFFNQYIHEFPIVFTLITIHTRKKMIYI